MRNVPSWTSHVYLQTYRSTREWDINITLDSSVKLFE